MGFQKEYHIFDALYITASQGVMKKRLNTLKRLIKNNKLMTSNKNSDLLKLIDFHRNTSNYFDYFDYLHNKSQDVKIVGDITPSYSGLPIEAFENIKKEAEERGFTVKVVFLMRDPLERIWSTIRMHRRNIKKKEPK